MTPFEHHNIKHLSPSSLNLWRDQPALWAVKYLMRIRENMGAAVWRGHAVEAGLAHWLHTGDEDVSENKALDHFRFRHEEAGSPDDPDYDKELDAILPMLGEACKAFAGRKKPLLQLRVEHWFDGLEVPVIGYVDFAFEDADYDLKSTHRCPSEPRPDHARQVALYTAARGKPGHLVYVTPKKHVSYPVEPEEHLEAMRRDALSLQRFLDRVKNGSDALEMLPANLDHYRWSDETRAAVMDFAS